MIDKDAISINDVQQWMQSMLIQHLPISNLAISTTDIINDSKRLNADQHLSIYRQSYIARLRECMQSQFKCLSYALGHSLFQDFADQFLEIHPSDSYTLNDLGAKFTLFLEKTRPKDEKEDWPEFMIELAGFEYALSQAFDADEIATKIPNFHTADHLLTPAPNLLLFEHQFPICNFYLDFNAGLSPELPFPRQSYCAVSRQNYKLSLFQLGPDQYHFLNFMISGSTIFEAQAQLIALFNFSIKDFNLIWPMWRKNFIASGFIVEKE